MTSDIEFKYKYDLPLYTKQNELESATRELMASNNSLADYQRLQEKYHSLQVKHVDLLQKHQASIAAIETKSRENETTAALLGAELTQLSAHLKNKNGELADIQGENKALKELLGNRESDLHSQSEFMQELQEARSSLLEDRNKLEDLQRMEGETVKKLEIQLTRRQALNEETLKKLEKTEYQNKEKKQCIERLSKRLKSYEDENNALERENQGLMNKLIEMKNAVTQTNSDINGEEFCLSELDSAKARLTQELFMHRTELMKECEAFKEGSSRAKNRLLMLGHLEKRLETEQRECNFILSKNAEIVPINIKLRQDLDFCKAHLENLRRNNENVSANIQEYRAQNVKVIQELQKRVDTANPLQQTLSRQNSSSQLPAVALSSPKMEASRQTMASSRFIMRQKINI